MSDFIQEFITHTESIASPLMFRKWTALGLMSALMSRRVWTTMGSGTVLHPNLFTFLVGKPTKGKSWPLRVARDIIAASVPLMRHVALTPDKVTSAHLVQLMAPLFKGFDEEGDDDGRWSFNALISEVGNFIEKPDVTYMQQLADLWDCPATWGKGTNKDGDYTLVKPYFTMLAGVQPAWISLMMAQDTIGLGLPSRVMFVHTEEEKEFVPFEPAPDPNEYKGLVRMAEKVVEFAGFVPFTKDAQKVILDWYAQGKPGLDGTPYQGYGQFEHYAGRRHMHLGKLSLIFAAARHINVPKILTEDVEAAMSTLFEAEVGLPQVLSAFGGNPFRMSEERILDQLSRESKRLGRGIAEAELRNWINQSIPAQHEDAVINGMIARGAIIPTDRTARANRIFKPGAIK